MSKSVYCEAMEVQTQVDADAMFEQLVNECMENRPCGRKEAESIQRSNLGYFAGYYSRDVRARIERLYHCAHPIFGPVADNGEPSAEQAFQAGLEMGKAARKGTR